MGNNLWDYPLRKHHRLCDRVRPLIKPLFEAFKISHFCYFFVDEKGSTSCLSSNPEWMEYYLHQNLFIHNPFLKDPRVIPEGTFFTRAIQDRAYQRSSKIAKNFGIEDSIVLTEKQEGKLTGFSFGFAPGKHNDSLFANELPLLKRFCQEFEKNAQKQLLDLEVVDILPFVGNAFYKTQESFFLNVKARANFIAHLKIPLPKLSAREKQCLILYVNGQTARSIAEVLDLSIRTVESYLGNIKIKLNCADKRELIKKGKELQDCGLL